MRAFCCCFGVWVFFGWWFGLGVGFCGLVVWVLCWWSGLLGGCGCCCGSVALLLSSLLVIHLRLTCLRLPCTLSATTPCLVASCIYANVATVIRCAVSCSIPSRTSGGHWEVCRPLAGATAALATCLPCELLAVALQGRGILVVCAIASGIGGTWLPMGNPHAALELPQVELSMA